MSSLHALREPSGTDQLIASAGQYGMPPIAFGCTPANSIQIGMRSELMPPFAIATNENGLRELCRTAQPLGEDLYCVAEVILRRFDDVGAEIGGRFRLQRPQRVRQLLGELEDRGELVGLAGTRGVELMLG